MHTISGHTVPGTGTVHHCQTRRGRRFGVVVEHSGRRTLVVYVTDDPDAPGHALVLDRDEADGLAQLLHDRPAADRLAELERRTATAERRIADLEDRLASLSEP
jgi:TrkA domain protein